jgi:hypothetical protein
VSFGWPKDEFNIIFVASMKVIVHPLVLLSVVDHYHRVLGSPDSVATTSSRPKRVLGVLLGQMQRQNGLVNVSNSFAGMRGGCCYFC